MRTVQILRLIARYNLRSLHTRALATATILASVAVVVGVFCYLLALSDGLRRALSIAADPNNVIVLAESATAESNSAITPDDAQRLSSLPQLARSPNGRPLVSPEVAAQTNVIRRGDPSRAIAGLAVRGVDLEVALAVHPVVQLVSGRWFRPGANELAVGEAASKQFQNVTVGSNIACGDDTFTIVGVFRAGGGPHESELWGHLSNVASAYRREMYSCAVVRLQTPDDSQVKGALKRIGSSALALRGIREDRYYAGQSNNARIVEGMALLLLAIMGIGAVFAAMNTFHSSLMGRLHEIGMLRSVGFSSGVVLAGLLVEAVLIGLVGGCLGCIAAALSILLGGPSRDLVGSTTFTSVAFTVRLRPFHIALSLLVALIIGILGGLWPTRQALRNCVISVLRSG
jgi:putative ABC transport system permease protein